MPTLTRSFEPPESFNLADYFLDQRIVEGHGERTALRLADRELSYRQVQALANRMGHVLRHLGVRQEERVMIALPDGAEFVGALFGTLKIGAVVVMVNPHLKPEEVAALHAYTRPSCVVVHDSVAAGFRDAITGGEDPLPGATRWLVVGGPETADDSFERLQTQVSDTLENVATHRDDPAIWLFSGGTT
ncbi:MAG: AMP-binding protein, partial [Acidobacteriota bacterium]